MLEADGELRYNTAVLIGPDGALLGKYRKHKLEHELVRNTPGDQTPVFRTPFGQIGIMICADRRDPDLVKRLAGGGADLLICPSGGMFGPKSNDHILQARSKENNLPILFVHPAEFLVTGPDGQIQSRTILGDKLAPDARDEARDIVRANGGVAEALVVARDFADRASAALEPLGDTVAAEALGAAADHLISKVTEAAAAAS